MNGTENVVSVLRSWCGILLVGRVHEVKYEGRGRERGDGTHRSTNAMMRSMKMGTVCRSYIAYQEKRYSKMTEWWDMDVRVW